MCDYSLHHVKSRPAKVGDKLTTHNFNTGTRGFAAPEDARTAVCILPGTELAFSEDVKCALPGFFGWKTKKINARTAIFRQVNTNMLRAHHDALEFPDGTCVLLTNPTRGSGSNSPSASRTAKDSGRREGSDARSLHRLKRWTTLAPPERSVASQRVSRRLSLPQWPASPGEDLIRSETDGAQQACYELSLGPLRRPIVCGDRLFDHSN